MGNRLDGKVCVVTGAGSGMGRASAIEMARQGGRVVVTDVNAERGQQTVDAITGEEQVAIYVPCDLRKPADIAKLMDSAGDHFGAIDVLHNNAAIHETDLTERRRSKIFPTRFGMPSTR